MKKKWTTRQTMKLYPDPWPKRPPRPKASKCSVFSLVTGFLLVLISIKCAFFRTPLRELADKLISNQMKLTESSMMTNLWKDPPLTPKLHVYLYNVTNHEDFISGKVAKLKVNEIGPYVYEAPQRKKILHYSEDQSAVTFQSRIDYKFQPEMSGFGLNDETDMVTMPNLLMMAGMLKSDVRPLPNLLKKSVVWPILNSAGSKTPFVTLSVADFLWGYEDELACLDSNPQETQYDDPFGDFGSDDFFSDIIEEPIDKPKKKNFRRADGKCMFGALTERNGSWDDPKTMLTGLHTLADKGTILDMNGSPYFNVWQKGSECDRVAGSREPSSLPSCENIDSFQMLMGIMCRKIRMEFDANINYSQGIIAKRFVMSKETFEMNHSTNQCFDHQNSGHSATDNAESELPNGIFSVAKCAEGSPMAVSLPHFLYGDKW